MDAVGGRADANQAADRRGAGQGAPRDGRLQAVRGGDRTDRAGERGDLRGPPGAARRGRRQLTWPAGRGKRWLRHAPVAEASAELARLAAEAARAIGCGSMEAAEAVIR